MKEMKKRVNYRIIKELKERIKKNPRYKNLSYFIREALRDFIDNPVSREDIHNLTESMKNVYMITSTVLIFENDKVNLENILKNQTTYQFDIIYLLTLIIYNYSMKEKLI